MRVCVRVVRCTHNVSEVEARMARPEMFEKAEELHAVERAPGAVQVVARLRLLPRVVVVEELVEDAAFPWRRRGNVPVLPVVDQFLRH